MLYPQPYEQAFGVWVCVSAPLYTTAAHPSLAGGFFLAIPSLSPEEREKDRHRRRKRLD